jgi:GntR family transcriptional regulator / MocR family aminotransferase
MFILDSKDRRPLHVKLYHQIKNQILSGKLSPHSKLPSVRHLSAELSVSRNTVEYAYEQLCTEGFIHSKPRSGYYISLLDQEFIPRPCRNPVSLIEPAFEDGKTYSFDFHPAGLSPDSFPSKVWRKLVTDCLQENPGQFALYGNPQGETELRCEIQRYLERFRGVSCDPEQIVVCSGLQDSLSIIAQILRGDHSALAVEDPGHWIPRSIFQNYAFSLSPIPVNSEGINLDDLKNTNSTIVYVTPSHQFPLGYVMPVENRLKLINWTETVGGVIIEDDYDSELRYHGKPIPALQGLHPEGNIIYVGTFAKVLSPALRVSYMVLPYQFFSTYKKLFSKYATTVSLLEQRTLCEFMKQGYWERHLRRMRTIYKRKHDALIQSINRHFSNRVNILGQGAGLHVVLELVDNLLDEKELISRAWEKNVRVFPLSDTYQCNKHYPSRVMLGFGRMNPDELERGIELLSQAWNL